MRGSRESWIVSSLTCLTPAFFRRNATDTSAFSASAVPSSETTVSSSLRIKGPWNPFDVDEVQEKNRAMLRGQRRVNPPGLCRREKS